MTKGYMFIAFGKLYANECINLVKTIRKTGDELPASVLTSEKDAKFLEKTNLFDNIIKYDFNHYLHKNDCNTSFEKYCVIPTLRFNEFLPYDKTIITDTDMLCQYNPIDVWNQLSKPDYAVSGIGRNNSDDGHYGRNKIISEIINKPVPETHTGIFHIDKNHRDLDKYFKKTIEIYQNYESYGCLPQGYRGGRADEVIFSITNSLFDYKVNESRIIMTFNYHGDIDLPSKIQTFGKKNNPNAQEMDKFIPFIHMFKNELGRDRDYSQLLNRLLK